MSIFLNHARHNKEAFDYLHTAAPKFPDWTVTTAFYCAMHYCYAIIFPLTDANGTYNNIEQYHNSKGGVESKHKMTLILVRNLHPIIGEKYKLLKDVAHTSRYQDYNIPSPVVSQVKKCLKVIEDYCENIANPPVATTPTPSTTPSHP